MHVYRINKEPYQADPSSVIGSERHGGRWNPKGAGILYTSQSPALALLETLVHLPPVGLAELPCLRLSTLGNPEGAETVFWIAPDRLPPYWQSGTLNLTQDILADWLNEPFCLALAVPSAIIDVSYNVLLHPQHPAYAEVVVVGQRPLPLGSRLR